MDGQVDRLIEVLEEIAAKLDRIGTLIVSTNENTHQDMQDIVSSVDRVSMAAIGLILGDEGLDEEEDESLSDH